MLLRIHNIIHVLFAFSKETFLLFLIVNVKQNAEYGTGSKISIEGDVYSYGIIILEMLTGKRQRMSCLIMV